MSVKRLEKYKWIYQENEAERYLPFSVIPPDDIKRDQPQTLYKYYGLTGDNIAALEGFYLYAPHPYQMNDLFDCHEGLIQFDDAVVIEKLFPGLIPNKTLTESCSLSHEILKKAQVNYIRSLYSHVGILSFTEDGLNPQMWSYYTGNKGFMVEFGLSHFNFRFHGPFQINYQEKIEPISLKEWELPLCTLYQTNVKTKAWEHEKEWRMLSEKANMNFPGFKQSPGIESVERHFEYDRLAIKRIVLGNRFFNIEDDVLVDAEANICTLKDNDHTKLKRRLLNFIITNEILTEMIVRNPDKFDISNVPFEIDKNGKFDKKYIYPILKLQNEGKD
jgi:hypothetical protein